MKKKRCNKTTIYYRKNKSVKASNVVHKILTNNLSASKGTIEINTHAWYQKQGNCQSTFSVATFCEINMHTSISKTNNKQHIKTRP